MPLAYNEETGEVMPYLERKFVSKPEAMNMFSDKPKKPKIVNVIQGSEDWYELRSNHLGASCAGIIMGCDPYRTKRQLWLEMIGVGEKQKEHAGMARGKALEPIALDLYNQEKALIFEPMVLQSDKESFMICSLDGITKDLKNACEIKCLSLETHNKKEILPQHYAQMQHQLFVCDLDEMDYVSYHPNASDVKPLYILTVKRDEAFLADYIPKAKIFWDCVQSFTAPELTEKDYRDFTKNAEYAALDAAYVDIDEKLKGLEKQKEEIRRLMEEMSEGNNVLGPYTKMTHYPSKGKIDYKKAVIENLPELDLEGYRGKPISAIRITKV